MVVTSAIILACLALAELSCDRKRTVTTQNLSEDVGADLPAVDVLKIKDVYTSPDTNNVSDAEGLPESEISEEIQDTYQEVHPPSEYEKCLKLKINKTGDDIKAGLPFAGCLDEVSLAMYPDITLCVKAYAYLIPMPGVSQVQLEAFGGPDNLMGYGLTYTLERFFDTTDEEDRIWFNYEWILCPKCMDPDEGASVEPSHWILPPKFISRYRPINGMPEVSTDVQVWAKVCDAVSIKNMYGADPVDEMEVVEVESGWSTYETNGNANGVSTNMLIEDKSDSPWFSLLVYNENSENCARSACAVVDSIEKVESLSNNKPKEVVKIKNPSLESIFNAMWQSPTGSYFIHISLSGAMHVYPNMFSRKYRCDINDADKENSFYDSGHPYSRVVWVCDDKDDSYPPKYRLTISAERKYIPDEEKNPDKDYNYFVQLIHENIDDGILAGSMCYYTSTTELDEKGIDPKACPQCGKGSEGVCLKEPKE